MTFLTLLGWFFIISWNFDATRQTADESYKMFMVESYSWQLNKSSRYLNSHKSRWGVREKWKSTSSLLISFNFPSLDIKTSAMGMSWIDLRRLVDNDDKLKSTNKCYLIATTFTSRIKSFVSTRSRFGMTVILSRHCKNYLFEFSLSPNVRRQEQMKRLKKIKIFFLKQILAFAQKTFTFLSFPAFALILFNTSLENSLTQFPSLCCCCNPKRAACILIKNFPLDGNINVFRSEFWYTKWVAKATGKKVKIKFFGFTQLWVDRDILWIILVNNSMHIYAMAWWSWLCTTSSKRN